MRIVKVNPIMGMIGITIFITSSAYSATNVSGNQSGIWTKAKSPYILTGTVTVATGHTLIIQAGVTVLFPMYNFDLIINGTLNATGTASDSIKFKGTANEVYNTFYGGAIYLNTNSSVLKYVSADSLGYNAPSFSIADNVTPALAGVSVRNSNYSDFNTWIGGAKNFSNINGLINVKTGDITSDATIAKIVGNTYYNIVGQVHVNSGVTLTIKPGAHVVFASYFDFVVDGKLNAQGLANDSIKLSGRFNSGYNTYFGGSIYLNNDSTTLDYVSIDSLGYSQSALIISDGKTPSVSNTSIMHTGSMDVYTWIGGAKNFANINGLINVKTGDVTGDATMAKIAGNTYYNLIGQVHVNPGVTLTIKPGAQVVFTSYSDLAVDGKLNAQGLATDSIKLRGRFNVDYNINFGGSIYLNNDSATLDYVSIDSLGYSQSALIIADGKTPSVSNISIKHTGSMDVYTWIGGAKNFSKINGLINIKTGDVTSDATIAKIVGNTYYNLLGQVHVNSGVTLTIKPGAQVVFASYSTDLVVDGKLNAEGLVNDSIKLIGKFNADYNTFFGGSIFLNNDSATLDYVSIDSLGNSQSALIIADRKTPSVSNTSINHTGSIDVYTWVGGAKNFSNIIGIVNVKDGYLNSNATISKIGGKSYYFFLGDVTVDNGYTLTISPGAKIILPSPYSNLIVKGILNAQGNSADSIKIKGTSNSYYSTLYGGSINLNNDSSVLTYVTADSLGYSTGSIIIGDDVSPTILNSSIRHSGSADINTWVGGCKNVNNIVGNVILKSSTLTSNATIYKLQGSFYTLESSITVNEGSTLTIQPGVKIIFPTANSNLFVNGILDALGNINDSIKFKGTKNQDNNTLYGGTVYINHDSSVLKFVSIDSLGDTYNYYGALAISSGSNVQYCSIRNSKNAGIYISSSSVNVSYCNIIKNETGIVVSDSKPILKNNNIYNNTTNYGVNNISQTNLVDATSSYWGASSGPYHPTLNPGGTGNKVSDSVKISPWKTSAVVPVLPYISLFAPAAGATDTVITIKGTRFTGITAVYFSGSAAKSFTVLNDSTITAVVGTGSSGNVKVTKPQGSDSLGGFVYCPGIALHSDFAFGVNFSDVNFLNKSDYANSYKWIFGDDIESTVYNATHHYASPNNYNVCLISTNACSRKNDTLCKIISITGLTFTDGDKDGLFDLTEPALYGTSNTSFDTNNDGLADGLNVFTGLKVLSADTDGDGISNVQEMVNGTNPLLADTDFDGVSDKFDAYPLDRSRSKSPQANLSDHTKPSMTLSEPLKN